LKTATSAPGRGLPSDGAEVRSATGITVFSGMIGVTLLGLFLTPVFYVGLRKLSRRDLIRHGEASLSHG
jgi:multidrug efflux pump